MGSYAFLSSALSCSFSLVPNGVDNLKSHRRFYFQQLQPATRLPQYTYAGKGKKTNVSMVVVPSNMLKLQTVAPDFALFEPLTGKTVSFSDVERKNGNLVMFLCSRCPFVVLLQEEIKKLGDDLRNMDIGMVGISSNDVVSFPHDDEVSMKKTAVNMFPTFPYLIDKTQDVAKSYMAACTPDLFLFDKNRHLVYRGQFDHARPGNGVEVTGSSIREAVNLLLQGVLIPEDEMWPSIGCHIKWIPGNEPDYF